MVWPNLPNNCHGCIRLFDQWLELLEHFPTIGRERELHAFCRMGKSWNGVIGNLRCFNLREDGHFVPAWADQIYTFLLRINLNSPISWTSLSSKKWKMERAQGKGTKSFSGVCIDVALVPEIGHYPSLRHESNAWRRPDSRFMWTGWPECRDCMQRKER